MKFDTQLLHEGKLEQESAGAITTPVFQSATYLLDGDQNYHDIRYSRLNNTPNHLVLHKRLAAIEGAEDALVSASGMAAISSTLLTLLKTGDHAIFQRVLYGGTSDILRDDLAALGIKATFVDPQQPDSWKNALTPQTKLIYVESISNPLLEVPDLRAVVDFARKHKLISVIDNTFASPANFRAAAFGFDLSLHSATKYLNGHSDITAGVVAGRKDLVRTILLKQNHLGGSLDPHACFLFERGLKTLGVRVRAQNAAAKMIAENLSRHPRVKKVIYPGLESHPQHIRARELFSGFGGMLGFVMDEKPASIDQRLRKMQLFALAPSLGGVESLVIRPAASSHKGLTNEELEACGISPSYVRVSVGLEDPADLVADLNSALS